MKIRRSPEDMLRAFLLSRGVCRRGFLRVLGHLRLHGGLENALLEGSHSYVEHSTQETIARDFLWLLERLYCPGGVLKTGYLHNMGVNLEGDLSKDWRKITAYSQTVSDILDFLERAYLALSPSDRRRRTWAQRRKS